MILALYRLVVILICILLFYFILAFSFDVTGQFTLRDMYEQFQNIMKMGPFGQIMVNSFCCRVCCDCLL